ncbi:hypothetical protein CF319_g436 [Tilletia indica]|nr:hypothetical protein CF319_g436 [Tilletia indica]KAE8231026.1 hypothetical protein CF326_g3969 [Tilletia indica]
MSSTSALPFADDPELSALLAASVQAHTAAAEAAAAAKTTSENPFAADEQQDIITFADHDDDEHDDEDEDDFQSAEARIAKERSSKDDWQKTARAALTNSGPITRAEDAADAAFDQVAAGEGASESLSHRARKRLSKDTRAATAGDAWYGLPRLIPQSTSSAPSPTDKDLTPAQRARALTAGHKNATVAADARSKTSAEIAREVQAIRLRNALDPKRFYRGAKGDRALALPEFAQIGTILPDELAPSQNLARTQRARSKGSVVEELLRDDTAKEYATRKFGELQDARGSWSAANSQKRKKGDGRKGSGSKKQRK